MSKKTNQKEKTPDASTATALSAQNDQVIMPQKPYCSVDHVDVEGAKESGNFEGNFDVNELFDFTSEGSFGLNWVNKFLELDEEPWLKENW